MFVDDAIAIDNQIFNQTWELQGDEWGPGIKVFLDSESDAEGEIEEWTGKIDLIFILIP